MRVRSQGVMPSLLSSSWFLVPKPNPQAKFRLFCFPYAGGTAEIYYSWVEELPEDIELVAIQYPGHIQGAKDTLYKRLSLLINDLSEELSSSLEQKYAFFGHSMGALVAYELARCIVAAGLRKPDHLFLSARNPPHLPIVHPLMHKMTNSEFIQIMHAFNVIPAEVVNNQGLLQIILPILKADFEMIETYQYNPHNTVLDVPICTFAGVNDNLAPPRNVAEWHKYTVKDFREITFPEKHYFLLNKVVKKTLINYIVQYIRDNSLSRYAQYRDEREG